MNLRLCKSFICLGLAIASFSVFAAEKDSLFHASITGYVEEELDSLEREIQKRVDLFSKPVEGCVAVLYYKGSGGETDSLHAVTGRKGLFSFRDVPVSDVRIRVSMLGFETIEESVPLAEGENLMVFTLKALREELEAAKVVSEIPLMKQVADTTIYNAAAVKTLPDESLRAILEALPGFSVGQESMTVNGRKVSRAYVNGTLVMGDRVMNAVEGLKADEVSQIKVYDELSASDRHRGKMNAPKERVLDIITKNAINSLSSAAAGVSVGADETGIPRYSAAAVASYNSEWTDAQIRLLADNMNINNLSWSIGDVSEKMYNYNPLTSYSNDGASLISFNKYWKNRLFGNSLAINYRSNLSKGSDLSSTLTDFFETAGNPTYSLSDTTSNKTSSQSRSIDMMLRIRDPKFKSWDISLSGVFDGANNISNYFQYRYSSGLQTKVSDETERSKLMSGLGNVSINWVNDDKVIWRPSAYAGLEFGRSSNPSWTTDTLSTSIKQRELSSDGLGVKINARTGAALERSLINSKAQTLDLRFFLDAAYVRDKSRRISTDSFNTTTPILDIASSYDYTRNNLSAGSGVGVKYSKHSGLSASASLAFRGTSLKSEDVLPYEYQNDKFFPSVDFEGELRGKNYSFYLNTSSLAPSLEQVSNRISDANPLILQGGNPDLSASYRVSANGFYSFSLPRKTANRIFIGVDAEYIIHPIIRQTVFFQNDTTLLSWDGYEAIAGSMLNTWNNSDMPSVRLSANAYYEARVFRGKIKLRVRPSQTFGQTPMYVGSSLMREMSSVSKLELFARFNPNRRFEFLSSITPGAAFTRNDNGSGRTSQLLCADKLSVTWHPLPNLLLRMRYSCNYRRFIEGNGTDFTERTLNAEISMPFGKKRNFTLALYGMNLLNSTALYETTTTASGIVETYRPVYGRYFLVSLQYSFRKTR